MIRVKNHHMPDTIRVEMPLERLSIATVSQTVE
jgi:hypothetical protein